MIGLKKFSRTKIWNSVAIAMIQALMIARVEAQSAIMAAPQFEVISIKPDKSNERGGGVRPIAGGIDARNVTVNMLLQSAYRLKPWQILGGPAWVRTDGYDIEAKTEGNPSFQQNLEMLRPLLADRFQLQFRRETRKMRVYALVIAKSGPKLQATVPGVPGYVRPGNGLLEGKGVTMADLAEFLGGSLGESVVDKTAIAGAFDIRLKWAPAGGEAGYNRSEREIDSDAASIFTAIQEQLGLKLEAGKGSVEALVIDHVDRPSAN